ncbi:hypothetical protein C8Q79DRAFT_631869 [Trametes meyenii]|nr:hypothetical protein C8Q79DRAFT_631869 [Trametes meyenii]
MNVHVSAQMKGVAGSAGSNNSYEEADRRKAEQMFGSSSMNTIGGNATLSSAEGWFNSLNDPMLWTMTRPTKTCSIVDLFKDDSEVYSRLKPIADAIAQEQRTLRAYIRDSMPLYRTDNARTGDMFFSMTQKEINEARPYGYQYHGLVARVLFPRPNTIV